VLHNQTGTAIRLDEERRAPSKFYPPNYITNAIARPFISVREMRAFTKSSNPPFPE
jgi:hypothetical protein